MMEIAACAPISPTSAPEAEGHHSVIDHPGRVNAGEGEIDVALQGEQIDPCGPTRAYE